MTGTIYCNPITRQQTPLRVSRDLKILGMYPHRPTGEYRVLLQQRWYINMIGLYVFALGTEQPPRYIRWPKTSSTFLNTPALVRDSLHWYPVDHHSDNNPLLYPTESKPLIMVFDPIVESFRRMRAPIVPNRSYIFEIDDTLGIYSHKSDTETVDIWVLRNYEGEVWDLKYKIKLPIAEIRRQFEGRDDYCHVAVVPVDGRVLLLVSLLRCVHHIDSDGKLVNSFHHGGGILRACAYRLKQTLVPHTFFTSLEGYVMKDSPFI
ncbi:hypothetical protein VPH35_062907 [Triticum aestivum]